MSSNSDVVRQKLERLGKWRTVFAGWQLGTRPKSDPECQAVRNHYEITVLLRAEVSALSRLLVEKGVFTAEEFLKALGEEADDLCTKYENQFPGFRATDIGIVMDKRATETTKGWRP